MNEANVFTAAYYALCVGFLLSTWRRTVRGRDAWYCAFGLLLLTVGQAIVLPPDPTIGGRLAMALTIGVWQAMVIYYWRQSGIPCSLRGHVWTITVKTPTGVMVMSAADPETEAKAMAKFAPRLLGLGWAAAPIIARTCAVCRKPKPLEGEPDVHDGKDSHKEPETRRD